MEDQHEELLAEQEKSLEKMEEENRQLFEALGIEGAELMTALQDQNRFTPEEWASLQRNREILEKAIDARILAAKTSKKPKKAQPSHIQGHWIFVR
jgi:predicted phage gp36 major capsid-like protein